MSKHGKKKFPKKKHQQQSKHQPSHGLDRENRAEEACYELRNLIQNNTTIKILEEIQKLCKKWKIDKAEIRKLWHALFEITPEGFFSTFHNLPIETRDKIKIRHSKGNSKGKGNHQKNQKKTPQKEAWSQLVSLVEESKAIQQLNN